MPGGVGTKRCDKIIGPKGLCETVAQIQVKRRKFWGFVTKMEQEADLGESLNRRERGERPL